MEMRGDAVHPTGQLGRPARLVFGSYAAETFSKAFGTTVLGRALVVPPIAGRLALGERGSAFSAQ